MGKAPERRKADESTPVCLLVSVLGRRSSILFYLLEENTVLD